MEEQNFKLAVVGTESSILLFKAFGAETYPVASSNEAQEVLSDIAARHLGDELQTPEFAVVFVEENFYKKLPDDLLTKLAQKALPAVVPVPSPDSKDSKFGSKRLSKIVERAVGSDILS